MKENKQHLDDFILQHRELFDDRDAPDRIWDRIEARLPASSEVKVRTIRIYKYIAAAAVALVLILSGVIAGMQLNKPAYRHTAEYRDFQKAELYYTSQIDQKMTALQQHQDDPILEQDLKQLDIVYHELKEQLMMSENPNKKSIIDAMIVNYQTRVAILERVLEKLSESEAFEQQIQSNHEEALDHM